MSVSTLGHRALAAAALLFVSTSSTTHAQGASIKPSTPRPAVCAKGVRVFSDGKQVPTPNEVVTIPPADGPVRVSSPEEAEAAELAVRGRAGSVGATAILFVDETYYEGGMTRMRRSVTGFFVPADSARAQLACKQP